MLQLPFLDRDQAARALAVALAKYRGTGALVLGIPRGGVPMARILADALQGDLDIVQVRKLGAPGNPEFAVGAVDERGSLFLNEEAIWSGVDEAYIERAARTQLALMRERRVRYGAGGLPDLTGRTVIVVDDGLATGSTMLAALRAVQAQGPARLVCAVPVAAADSLASVRRVADEVVCLATPHPFGAVGRYYREFDAVGDDGVARALRRSPQQPGVTVGCPVHIPVGRWMLEGTLTVPDAPLGLVVFVHASGSSRHSPRNRYVADALVRRRIATLLFDLLTVEEDVTPATRFDIALLDNRLETVVAWVRSHPRCCGLPIGLFGASTGAAAALRMAAARADAIATVVSRGGRPDLAGRDILQRIRTPVLLIVGAADRDVLLLNREAQVAMGAWAELAIVPSAGHLFEEPGALERMTTLATDWFERELRSAGRKQRAS